MRDEALKDPSKMHPIERIFFDVLKKANRNRLEDPTGDQFQKVSFEDWQKMLADPDSGFIPAAKYITDILCYTDGTPRATPVRPLVAREVGMRNGKIIYLKDAGPGDVGEGKYYVIGWEGDKKAPTEAPADPLAPTSLIIGVDK